MKKLIFTLFLICNFYLVSAETQAPFSTAGFHTLEGTGREAYSMNIGWRFSKSDVPNSESIDFDDSNWELIAIPHGLETLPIDASGGINYQGPAWYRKHFTPDNQLKNKKLFLHFEGIMGKSKVWINGTLISEYFGGYLPIIADITQLINWGKDNVISVRTDNSDDPLYPPGKAQDLLDFTYFGGIYRDCWLVAHNGLYITNPNYENEIAGGGLFVSYDEVSDKTATVNLKTHLRNELTKNFTGYLNFELINSEGTVIKKTTQKIHISMGRASHFTNSLKVNKPVLWSPDKPYLYRLNISVKDDKGKLIDGYMQKIGIRSIEFKQKDGLWINGKPYGKIMGTNRHQDYAVIGNAIPNSLQWRDAKKLRDAGMKVIRTHYVIDPAFMDACDELGMFALVETPGWQFWNNKPIFGERVYSDIRNMIRIHRNHASLFFLEPVLNETSYPSSFAQKAAEICKEEYPYPYMEASCDDGSDGAEYFKLLLRPTKNLDPSKTYFTREWGDNTDDWNAQNSDSRSARNWGEVPMLVQAEHYANDYAKIYNQSSQVVGGCFWHSFDHQRGYHPDPFYGGMMDAFRQAKTSYYMFMAQRDIVKGEFPAESGPMIYIANEMTPFSPEDVSIYSNCDEVRLTVFKNGKTYTHKKSSLNNQIPSPIITFKDVYTFMDMKKLARAGKQDDVYLLAEGLIDGKVVTSYKKYPSERPDHIRLRVDKENMDLVADGSDMICVVAELVDKRGTIKRLNNNSVRFSIEGEGHIIGDKETGTNPIPMTWGTAPVLVQSTTKAGEIKITATIVHEGSQRPLEGTITFNSSTNTVPAIYDLSEIQSLNRTSTSVTSKSIANSELEIEFRKLQKELNDLKLKEVEKQQTKFGEGIN